MAAVTAYFGLGSNLRERSEHLGYALRRLVAGGRVTGVSGVYETEPVGFLDQPSFLNLVVRLETELDPVTLLALARRIEKERGRERGFPNAPRTLDIDLLLYGDRRLDTPALTVPHPRMTQRPFVLIPLLELDPTLVEPGTGRSYGEYLPERVEGVRRIFDGERLVEPEG